mgnify:CR=1 FL=1
MKADKERKKYKMPQLALGMRNNLREATKKKGSACQETIFEFLFPLSLSLSPLLALMVWLSHLQIGSAHV